MKGFRINATRAMAGFMLGAVLTVGCSQKKIVVEVPPRIDLGAYQTIGILEMSSNSTADLNQLATQRFMAHIQKGQPQVRFLELGPEDRALQGIGDGRLDPAAVKALGKKFGVSTIFSGSYEVSEPRPSFTVGEDLSSVKAAATVRIAMHVKHWDAVSGATLWTDSGSGQWPVASVSKDPGGGVSFSLSVPEDRYGQFISKLTYAVTEDFRAHYETRRVPRK